MFETQIRTKGCVSATISKRASLTAAGTGVLGEGSFNIWHKARSAVRSVLPIVHEQWYWSLCCGQTNVAPKSPLKVEVAVLPVSQLHSVKYVTNHAPCREDLRFVFCFLNVSWAFVLFTEYVDWKRNSELVYVRSYVLFPVLEFRLSLLLWPSWRI